MSPVLPGQGRSSFFVPLPMRAALGLYAISETSVLLRRARFELIADCAGPVWDSDADSLAVDFRGRFRGDL